MGYLALNENIEEMLSLDVSTFYILNFCTHASQRILSISTLNESKKFTTVNDPIKS